MQTLNIAGSVLFGSGYHHPARAKTGQAIGFGEAVKGQAEHLFCQGCHGHMLGIIVEDAVIDLVCKNDQVVFFRQGDNLLQIFFTVNCTGWIIRVDNHDTLGGRGDFTFNIGN